MNYPEKTFLGKTWVGWLNIIVLQWFFVRLAGSWSDDDKFSWVLLFPIVPLTGWRSNYVPKEHRTFQLKE